MPWALLWQYRKYLGILGLLVGVIGLSCYAVHKHDEGVAAKAVQVERKAKFMEEYKSIDSLVKDKNVLLDSIAQLNEQEIEKRSTVRKHTEKLVEVQSSDESAVQSFLAKARDSTREVAIDSLRGLYEPVVSNLKEQLKDAAIIRGSLEADLQRQDDMLEIKDVQLAALTDFNRRLHADLDAKPPASGESVGHFIIHKALPVGILTVGTVVTARKVFGKQ